MRAAPADARSVAPRALRMSRANLIERLPGYAGQALLAALVGVLVSFGVSNFVANLHALRVTAGWGFLRMQAGFDIAQTLIAFTPQSSYLDAIVVAALNTLLVVVLASAFSTAIGVVVAFGRMTPPGVMRSASSAYVEVFRNVPLLLQILFWYSSAIALLPGVADSLQLGPVLLNNRGLFLPGVQVGHDAWTLVLQRPQVDGFDVSGGVAILPELMALTLGLSIYNGAFFAEIFRAGILSVPRGQAEAATTLGLSGVRAALLVTLPQALHVALPAAGGQYQTLAKASALAAAIGYPDIMQIVGGTVLSQTSQALEAMTLVVLLYAAINLGIALIVGVANRRLSIAEGRAC
jgi:general L-amino acid transport system permease protein